MRVKHLEALWCSLGWRRENSGNFLTSHPQLLLFLSEREPNPTDTTGGLHTGSERKGCEQGLAGGGFLNPKAVGVSQGLRQTEGCTLDQLELGQCPPPIPLLVPRATHVLTILTSRADEMRLEGGRALEEDEPCCLGVPGEQADSFLPRF